MLQAGCACDNDGVNYRPSQSEFAAGFNAWKGASDVSVAVGALHRDEHAGECDRQDSQLDNRDAVKQGVAVHPQKVGHRHQPDIVLWVRVVATRPGHNVTST